MPPPPMDAPPPDDAIVPPPPDGAPPDDGIPGPPEGPPPPPGIPPPPSDAPPGGALVPEKNASNNADVRSIVKRGRFHVKCVQGLEIRKKGQAAAKTKIDAYLRLTLGKHKKAPRKKTTVHKRSGSNPNFQNEMVSFDVMEPMDFVTDDDIVLTVELWDENAWSHDLIASLELSILRFMHAPEAAMETLPLRFAGDDTNNSQLQLEFRFEPAMVGMAVFTLYEGRGLKNMETIGKQDPYVKLKLGDKLEKKSKTCKDGGQNPYFKEEQILVWVDRTSWVHNVQLHVFDEDVGNDDLIGQCDFSLLPYMTTHPDEAKEQLYELTNPNHNKSHGELLMKVQFLPAGVLTVKCIAGKNLRETDGIGRQDPYVVFGSEGQAVKVTKKTKVDTDGGTAPQWNETLTMDIVDQYTLNIECFDHDMLSKDDLIGKTSVSLLPVFKRGMIDNWVTIKTKNEWGPPKDAGEIHLTFEFTGPSGIAYPQHQPSVDSFDETERIHKLKEEIAELEGDEAGAKQAKESAELADQVMERLAAPQGQQRSTEFSDAEIESAFRFIDLDKNGFVGAAEIRHILVCMGELITDEEVDMMVTMVDSDGDGQISYEEFYDIVTDPDPSRPDFRKQAGADGDGGAQKSSGGPMDAKAHERQKEIGTRDEKRRMLGLFVEDNNIGPAEVNYAFEKYQNLPQDQRKSGVVNFDMFCELLAVEPTGEYHKLFTLFDADNSGSVDVKEFILGLCNFVEMDKDSRIKFIFELFDEDRSGFLSTAELLAVLKANHMQSEKAVKQKANTIMKHADRDGSGTLSLDEFVVVSKKFPNILFPSIGVGSGGAEGG